MPELKLNISDRDSASESFFTNSIALDYVGQIIAVNAHLALESPFCQTGLEHGEMLCTLLTGAAALLRETQSGYEIIQQKLVDTAHVD